MLTLNWGKKPCSTWTCFLCYLYFFLLYHKDAFLKLVWEHLAWSCEKKYIVWDLHHWKKYMQLRKITGQGAKAEFMGGK